MDLLTSITGSVMRHLLTGVGGVLVAQGWVSAEDWEKLLAGAILAAKVNNPITGKPATVATYLNSINANAYSARLDAAAARKVAEAQAAAGRPLTAAEIEAAAKAGVDAALDDRIGEATVNLNVTGGAK